MKLKKVPGRVIAHPIEEPERRPQLEFNATEATPPESWTLTSLLEPVAVKEFCQTYWGKFPLLIRKGAPDYFSSLISLADLDGFMSLPGAFADQSTVLKSKSLPRERHFNVASELYAQMCKGASLQFRDMERFLAYDAPLRQLNQDIVSILQHPGDSVRCFVTPPGRELLGPHHDETEIFTLQISGTKHWKLFHRVCTDSPGGYRKEELGEPSAQVSLKAGDILYVPRGLAHEVTSEDSMSFSVAILLAPMTWRSLLHAAVGELEGEAEFMEQLPANALLATEPEQGFSAQIAARLELAAEKIRRCDDQKMVDRMAEDFLDRMTLPPRKIVESVSGSQALTLDTQVARLEGLAYKLIEENVARLVISGGEEVTAPLSAVGVLKDIMNRAGPFRVSDLHDDLPESSRLDLARDLLSIGALMIVPVPLPQ